MKRVLLLGLAVVIATFAPPSQAETTFKTDLAEINLNGRVHLQFNTTSVENEAATEFLLRRARITFGFRFNDNLSARFETEYGLEFAGVLDAYMGLDLGPQWHFRLGQFFRPFDVFRTTEANDLRVIERMGNVRGSFATDQVSFTRLTRENEFSGRDIGIYGAFWGKNRKMKVEGSVTNGRGVDSEPGLPGDSDWADTPTSNKQFILQAEVHPSEKLRFQIGGASRPYAEFESSPDSSKVSRVALASQLALEWGSYDSGFHAVWGLSSGDDWVRNPVDPPEFFATQLIVSYKKALDADRAVFEAWAPAFRFSYADPDRDTKEDGGFLITPALQLFIKKLNKIAFDLDIYVPEKSDRNTEWSFKIQSYFIF